MKLDKRTIDGLRERMKDATSEERAELARSLLSLPDLHRKSAQFEIGAGLLWASRAGVMFALAIILFYLEQASGKTFSYGWAGLIFSGVAACCWPNQIAHGVDPIASFAGSSFDGKPRYVLAAGWICLAATTVLANRAAA